MLGQSLASFLLVISATQEPELTCADLHNPAYIPGADQPEAVRLSYDVVRRVLQRDMLLSLVREALANDIDAMVTQTLAEPSIGHATETRRVSAHRAAEAALSACALEIEPLMVARVTNDFQILGIPTLREIQAFLLASESWRFRDPNHWNSDQRTAFEAFVVSPSGMALVGMRIPIENSLGASLDQFETIARADMMTAIRRTLETEE